MCLDFRVKAVRFLAALVLPLTQCLCRDPAKAGVQQVPGPKKANEDMTPVSLLGTVRARI